MDHVVRPELMDLTAATATMVVLLALALAVLILRFEVRICVEKRLPIISDYFITAGWFCALAWVLCQSLALREFERTGFLPDRAAEWAFASSRYLKTVFIANLFFDIGLMLPKISMIMYYWWLIPTSATTLRRVLCICTVYAVCAFLATVLSDLLYCRPISDNWSVENQSSAIWESLSNLTVIWVLNITTDAILFLMPLFIFRSIKLKRPQKLSLMSIFMLGLLTMGVSASRFAGTQPPADFDHQYGAIGAIWSTTEICVYIIAACVPTLKNLIARSIDKFGMGRNNAESARGTDDQGGISEMTSAKDTSLLQQQSQTRELRQSQIEIVRSPSGEITGHDGHVQKEYDKLPDFNIADVTLDDGRAVTTRSSMRSNSLTPFRSFSCISIDEAGEEKSYQ